LQQVFLFFDTAICKADFEVKAGINDTTTQLCADSAELDANNLLHGEGKWMIVKGEGFFDDDSRHNTWVRGLNLS
jgi:predicted nucleic acid-binding Zn ribbon protein